MKHFIILSVALMFGWPIALQAWGDKGTKREMPSREVAASRKKGLEWLTKHQGLDGAWGKVYSIGVTSIACLAYLSASDEPFVGERGQCLVKGLKFLLDNQKDGVFTSQEASWIHGQGFATLALAEAYGRSLFCKTKPDLDMKKVREVVAKAIAVIAKNQARAGGWWYMPGVLDKHEGSTTVCAVQALVSARNFGSPIDEKVLDRGFDYLKKCQTKEGGFNYRLGDGTNKTGVTAGALASLGLMQKFDTTVMIKGFKFLDKLTPEHPGEFPFYTYFYGSTAMLLLGQEFKEDKETRRKTAAYIAGAQKVLVRWQAKDGTWPSTNIYVQNDYYPTAFATLALFVADARLSIQNHAPPKLPKGPGEKN